MHVYYYPFISSGIAETIYGIADECCWWDNQGGITVNVFQSFVDQSLDFQIQSIQICRKHLEL